MIRECKYYGGWCFGSALGLAVLLLSMNLSEKTEGQGWNLFLLFVGTGIGLIWARWLAMRANTDLIHFRVERRIVKHK